MIRLVGLCLLLIHLLPAAGADRPNFILIFADDLGYGDLGCYGHPSIRTPHFDRMAREGMRFTDFYCAAPVCTPSRAGLLTGRYPVRSGMCSDGRAVLFPDSLGGLPAEEITVAELLKARGYATSCIGKWHLGHLPRHLPTRHGFDRYFGIPYSNDMRPKELPLMRNEEVVERPADQTTLTRRYTEEAIQFMEAHRKQPFFIYLAHTFPHVPLFASPEFKGKSPRGLYGDVVEEMDWSLGRILDALRKLKLDRKTLVVFTSDNGPWLTQKLNGGSAGLLREGKGSTWDGGMRVPALAWWPGKIPAGTIRTELAATLDVLPTFAALAGAKLPAGVPLDGFNITPLLLGKGPSPRQEFYFYRGTQLFAVREGPFKAHFKTQTGYGQKLPDVHDPPLLFHLTLDPSEQHNVADRHPQVVERMRQLAERHQAVMTRGENQLDALIPVTPP